MRQGTIDPLDDAVDHSNEFRFQAAALSAPARVSAQNNNRGRSRGSTSLKETFSVSGMCGMKQQSLQSNSGYVISRQELQDEVCKNKHDRSVDNQIMLLRKKLERDPLTPVHFRTVHGVGYKFVP